MENIVKAWQMAADDLGLDIQAPYEVDLSNGEKITAPVLISNFGGEKGMLILTDDDVFWKHHETLTDRGFGVSVSEETTPYDRDEFIDMLSDWGWEGGPDNRPVWLKNLS